MFLSIIIPVYNTEKYLAECLDSCLEQDIPREDYEIICVNDGSKDGSAAILEDYAARYPNIRVLHQENGGVSSARNAALDLAQGDFLAFLDSDDFIEQNILGEFRRLTTSGNFDRVAFPIYEFLDELSPEEQRRKREGQLPVQMIKEDTLITTCLFRRSVLAHHPLRFNTELTHGEDTLWLHQYKCISGEKIDFCARPVYFYRRNISSATMSHSVSATCRAARSYCKLSAILYELYRSQHSCGSPHITSTANYCMLTLRKSLEQTAQLPLKEYRDMVSLLRSSNLFPFRQLPECTYTWQECANEPSGTGKLRNIFRYYSIHPVGLFLAAFPYRLQRLKIRLSRMLRKNPLMNAVLNLKNKLLGR